MPFRDRPMCGDAGVKSSSHVSDATFLQQNYLKPLTIETKHPKKL
jgi:hypothetical protein